MSAGGFEPSTNGVIGHCSAVELRARNEIGERFAFYHVKILPSTSNEFRFSVVCTVEAQMKELQTVSESSFQNEVIDSSGPVLWISAPYGAVRVKCSTQLCINSLKSGRAR